MVRKSYGKMRGTRFKMQGKEKPTVNDFLAQFQPGEKVHIDFSSHIGIPNPKFQGRTGTVLARRGNGYEIQVTDMDAVKKIYLKPEHLRKA
ncbi:MAG: 50S ribosomal protein L21e [Candidatus Aenigmarchaeota archaeon]|nr:50S ribosomal protein L21e [Candidatus Aenigmarchaeota archaeon]